MSKLDILYKAKPSDVGNTALYVQFQLTPWTDTLTPQQQTEWHLARHAKGGPLRSWADSAAGLVIASEWADRLAARGMTARVIRSDGPPAIDI